MAETQAEEVQETPPEDQYNPAMLFFVSCVALATTAFIFSLRAAIMGDLEGAFAMDAETIGKATASAFLAFAIAIAVGSPMCDVVGMGNLLRLAALLNIIGVLMVIFTGSLTGIASPFWILWLGMFLAGLGNGLVEAVINPLIASIYRDDKTHKLNVLHAWWPGGLIIGGLIGFGLGKLDVSWQAKFGVCLIPAVIYGLMVLAMRFPPTERVACGVPTRAMWLETLRPFFLVFWLCMFLTAATELGPNQWVEATLTKTIGFSGLLVLVYVSALMFILRHFAGPLAHRLSPVGLLWVSSLLAGIGLLALSVAKAPVTALVASTIFGAGVCYMWPTMLAVISERCPKGGALSMGLMGTAGQLSIFFVLPLFGKVYDFYTQKFLPAGVQLQSLLEDIKNGVAGAEATLEPARAAAVQYPFQYIAVLTIVLLIAFGIVWLRDRAMGGYKAVRLEEEMGAAAEEEPAEEEPARAEEAGDEEQ